MFQDSYVIYLYIYIYMRYERSMGIYFERLVHAMEGEREKKKAPEKKKFRTWTKKS